MGEIVSGKVNKKSTLPASSDLLLITLATLYSTFCYPVRISFRLKRVGWKNVDYTFYKINPDTHCIYFALYLIYLQKYNSYETKIYVGERPFTIFAVIRTIHT